MVAASEHLNRVFAALADPTRRRLLEDLQAGERQVSQLAEPFAMSLPAVSRHLKVLERAGLVQRTKEGRVHRMRAEPQGLEKAGSWINRYVEFWDHAFTALDAFLERTKPEPPTQEQSP